MKTKVFICLLAIVAVGFGLSKKSIPYTFTGGTPALAAQVNANFDTLDAAADMIIDTMNVKFIRYSALNSGDSTLDTLYLEALRGNPDVDSLAGNIVIDSISGNPKIDSISGRPNLWIIADTFVVTTEAVAIGTNSFSGGDYSVVIGGELDSATTDYTTSIGGYGNKSSAFYSATIGGRRNKATADFAVVLGGDDCVASGNADAVLGGENDTAAGQWSVVIGGVQNAIRSSGDGGDYSVILGGTQNKVDGGFATVLGGRENVINGTYSAAFGRLQTVTGDSTVVFGFNGGATTASSNLFRVNMDSMRVDGNLQVLGSFAIGGDFDVPGKLIVDDSLRVEGKLEVTDTLKTNRIAGRPGASYVFCDDLFGGLQITTNVIQYNQRGDGAGIAEISGDTLYPTSSRTLIDCESPATLDTVTIVSGDGLSLTSTKSNVFVTFTVRDGDSVLFVDDGNFLMLAGDFLLDHRSDVLTLLHLGDNKWAEVSRSDNQ
jgi:hypothetical protein